MNTSSLLRPAVLSTFIVLTGITQCFAVVKTIDVRVHGGTTGENKLGVGFGHLTQPPHILTINLIAPSNQNIASSSVSGSGSALWHFVGTPGPAPAHTYEIIDTEDGDFEDVGHTALFSGSLEGGAGEGSGEGTPPEFEVAVAEINITADEDDLTENKIEHPEDTSADEMVGLVVDPFEKKQISISVRSQSEGATTVSGTNGVLVSNAEEGAYVADLPSRSFSGGEDTFTVWVFQPEIQITGTVIATFQPANAVDSTKSAVDKLAVNPTEYTANDVKASLVSLKFFGDGYHQMKKKGKGTFSYDGMSFSDTGYVTIGTLYHWHKNGLNDPVCYTRDSQARMTAVFQVTNPTNDDIVFRLYPSGFDTITLTVPAMTDQAYFATTTGEDNLPNKVDNSLLTINWNYRVDGNPSASLITTAHQMFIVWDTPGGSELTAKRLSWATWFAGPANLANATDPGTTMNSTDIPRNIQHALKNGVSFLGGLGEAGGENAWSILDPGVGSNCVNQANLMMLALQILGIAEEKLEVVNVTSHVVPVTSWLGEAHDYSIIRDFREFDGHAWLNEGVCGVDVDDDEERLFYDVAIGKGLYGPRLHYQNGDPASDTTEGRVDNMWLEPNNPEEGDHGPVLWSWSFPWGRYSDNKTFASIGEWIVLPQVRIQQPNGGENITKGSSFLLKLYTAGLQGQIISVGYIQQDVGTPIYFGEITVSEAIGGEEEQFNNQEIAIILTDGLTIGKKYKLIARLKDTFGDEFRDESDDWFNVVAP